MIFDDVTNSNSELTNHTIITRKSKYYRPSENASTTPPCDIKRSTQNEVIREFFKKKFHFKKNSKWTLPSPNSILKSVNCNETVPELKSIKYQLNDVKDKLNEISLDVWSKFTGKRDPSSAIAWWIRSEIKAEFVTKAWCKFYECLSSYPIVQSDNLQFNSVHLCEAPGAFIAALNHYLKLNHSNLKFNWCATTLNPYYEGNSVDHTVLDDRFMLQTFHNWEFGVDFTGDVTNVKNISKLEARCRKMGKINLVTADGSVDCMECPHNQENNVYYLHFAEVITALRILDMDGCFVLKMFTFFELTTVSLLYFLNNVFDSVHVYKPASSKQGNSEVYVICIGYRRSYTTVNYLIKMTNYIQQSNIALFHLNEIPKDFIHQLYECNRFFMERQRNAIEWNLNHFRQLNDFRNTNDDKQKIHDLRCGIQQEYIRLYRLTSISNEMKIVASEKFPDNRHVNTPVCTYNSSLSERLIFKKLNANEKLNDLKVNLIELKNRISFYCRTDNLPLTLTNELNRKLKIVYGKPIERVRSSKFISIQCFKLLLEIIENSEMPNIDSTTMTTIFNSKNGTITIDIVKYKNIKNFDKFEKNFIHQLLNITINNIKYGDNLQINNLLLLTHFSVGIIYTLGCAFETILLTSKGEICLNKLQLNGKEILKKFLTQLEMGQINRNQSLVSIVDVQCITYNEFYNSITSYNNKLSIKYCEALLCN